ncbi:MAG TPA: BMP family ABC transporter substrate-binding protein [Clostridiaceae bacterium]|nr:BMP family ABC transporter substrate-binding protein [Clostridiaceae bacterium]
MKKFLLLVLVFLFILKVFIGCSFSKNNYEIALITEFDILDAKSFNHGAWEGLTKYAEEHKKTYQSYRPDEGSNTAYLEAIGLAVKNGAKIVVAPSSLFEVTIYEAQIKHPEVYFILLDGEPHTEDYKTYYTEKNVQPILYAEEEAGFMAGYAAVKDGFTKLGFQGGMAVPEVIRYGHGFPQGAEVAAKEMGLAEGSVSMMYNYSGDFAASPESQERAASWYKAGTEIIFACGGAVGNSVIAAAEETDGKFVIGADVDQYAESETVISSAIKMLANSVYQALAAYYDNKWEGETTWVLNAANDGVGLAMENARWRKFNNNDYNALVEAVKNKTYNINNKTDIGVTDLGLIYVNITEVKD